MNNINEITIAIKTAIKESDPGKSMEQIEWAKKILNPTNLNLKLYGLKVSELDKIARIIVKNYACSYKEAKSIFKTLVNTNVHDEKLAAISFINRFKKYFDKDLIELYYTTLRDHCDTWAFCDSSMIKVLGPFLARKANEKLATEVIKEWSESHHLWVRRASLVICLKIAMMKEDFNQVFLFALIEKLFNDSREYIQKGISWLLKQCSVYKPNIIFKYLEDNKKTFSREVLRHACKKLPERMKKEILTK